MFQGSFKGFSIKFKLCFGSVCTFQGRLKGIFRISRLFKDFSIFKISPRKFHWHLKCVSRMYKGSRNVVLRVSQENFKVASRIVQKCLEVLFCKFVVAWQASQLSEKKESMLRKSFH